MLVKIYKKTVFLVYFNLRDLEYKVSENFIFILMAYFSETRSAEVSLKSADKVVFFQALLRKKKC